MHSNSFWSTSTRGCVRAITLSIRSRYSFESLVYVQPYSFESLPHSLISDEHMILPLEIAAIPEPQNINFPQIDVVLPEPQNDGDVDEFPETTTVRREQKRLNDEMVAVLRESL